MKIRTEQLGPKRVDVAHNYTILGTVYEKLG